VVGVGMGGWVGGGRVCMGGVGTNLHACVYVRA